MKITPKIIKGLTPEDQPTFHLSKFVHEDMANKDGSTGLYSNKEVAISVQHIHEEDFRDAITKTIAYGSMSYNGVFNQDSDYNFDISRLSPVNIIKEMNLLQKIDSFLNKWGAWISLTVLMLEASKLVMTIAMIAYSLSKDGILGAKAIMYSLFCTKLYSTQSHLERAKRRRLKESREGDAEMRNLKDERDVETSEM